DVAVPMAARGTTGKFGENKVSNVITFGTTSEYSRILNADFQEGRFFNDTEDASGRAVCVLGFDIAEALFQGRSALGAQMFLNGHPYEVIGVLAKQGSFLGLFSFDNQAVIPVESFRKSFGTRRGSELRVKVTDRKRLTEAKEELIGAMRRVRAQLPGERDNFSVNDQGAIKELLDPIKQGIAMAGLFITGLSLFVGAIGIMNITFVSVKERTKEIGTRKALGARRRTILLQFLIEAVSICLIGGLVGLTLTYGLVFAVGHAFPA